MLIGYDPNGVRRVWGDSHQQCVMAIIEYLLRHPDTGPIAEWTVRPEYHELRLCEHG